MWFRAWIDLSSFYTHVRRVGVNRVMVHIAKILLALLLALLQDGWALHSIWFSVSKQKPLWNECTKNRCTAFSKEA